MVTGPPSRSVLWLLPACRYWKKAADTSYWFEGLKRIFVLVAVTGMVIRPDMQLA